VIAASYKSPSCAFSSSCCSSLVQVAHVPCAGRVDKLIVILQNLWADVGPSQGPRLAASTQHLDAAVVPSTCRKADVQLNQVEVSCFPV
jgi:hypothetical protein